MQSAKVCVRKGSCQEAASLFDIRAAREACRPLFDIRVAHEAYRPLFGIVVKWNAIHRQNAG